MAHNSMDCKDADELIMRYMDKTLTKPEAASLSEHISHCAQCRSDFEAYDDIVSAFETSELMEAPEGFEAAVMEKIEASGFKHTRNGLAERINSVIVGILSVLLTVGFICILYRNQILEYMSGSVNLAGYAEAVTPFVRVVNQIIEDTGMALSQFATNLITVAYDYKYAFLAAALGIIIVQFLVKRRSKVGE